MASFIKRLLRRSSSADEEGEGGGDGSANSGEMKKVSSAFDEYYPPEVIGESVILSEEETIWLDKQLPLRLVCSRWILAFSTDQHGFSLANMYHYLRDWYGPIMLVVLDRNKNRFGAFVTDSLHPDYKIRGGGECFVFRLKNEEFAQKYGGSSLAGGGGKEGDKNRSQSLNDFVMVGESSEGGTTTDDDCEDMVTSASSVATSTCDDDEAPVNANVNSGGDDATATETTVNFELTCTGGRITDATLSHPLLPDGAAVENESASPTLPPQTGAAAAPTVGSEPASVNEAVPAAVRISSDDNKKCQQQQQQEGEKQQQQLRNRRAQRRSQQVSRDGDDHMSDFDFSQHKVWHWAQEENCFIHGEREYIHIGLHDGKMSLWIDSNLCYGHSETTTVFQNEPLAPNPQGPQRPFEIVNLEVWAFKQ